MEETKVKTYKEYLKKECPKCKHYQLREYKNCNIVRQINNNIHCINYEQ